MRPAHVSLADAAAFSGAVVLLGNTEADLAAAEAQLRLSGPDVQTAGIGMLDLGDRAVLRLHFQRQRRGRLDRPLAPMPKPTRLTGYRLARLSFTPVRTFVPGDRLSDEDRSQPPLELAYWPGCVLLAWLDGPVYDAERYVIDFPVVTFEVSHARLTPATAAGER